MSDSNIAIVAGEPSGDLIAASLLNDIHDRTGASFFGIGGPHMQQAGMEICYRMDALSVFGYVDAIKQLPNLIKVYRGIKSQILSRHPQVFVGIDAPDFNLRLENQLRQKGIPTVHFVSPSIWAWRYERIHKIRKSVDHMLCLFPFEEEIYHKEDIPATFVGHPLAKRIPFEADPLEARRKLGLPEDSRVLAILPGSRASEIKQLGRVFLESAAIVAKDHPNLHFAVPLVNPARKQQFEQYLNDLKVPNLHIYDAAVDPEQPISWTVMQACDAALTASGTATLELSLFRKPMVIAYILTPLMLKIMQWRAKQERPSLPWIGLPNILLREFAVPEILQEEVTPSNLAAASQRALFDQPYRDELIHKFTQLHRSLCQDTAGLSADVILQVAQKSAGV